MKKQKYFYMRVRYWRTPRSTAHVIRAGSFAEAKRIAEKHGISNPFNSKDIISRTYREVFPEKVIIDQALIERRRRGRGGNIWYEDENGKLQHEK